jgi:uncharacterized protein
MPEIVDWQVRGGNPRPLRARFLILIVVVGFLALAGRISLSWWVELLWFRSLGFAEVFWRTLKLEWGVFWIFAAATFVLIYGAYLALKRVHKADLPASHTIIFGGRPIDIPIGRPLHFAAGIISLLIALIAGAAMKASWATLALWRHAPQGASGATDPFFSRPLGFYLFTLPAWDLVAGWLLAMAVIVLIMAALFLLVSGGSSAIDSGWTGIRLPWRGVSLALGFLLLVVAWHVWISRYELLFEHHTIFDGITYTGAHVTAPGLLTVAVVLVLGSLIAIMGGLVRPRAAWLGLAVAPAVVCYMGMSLASWYVDTFIVNPNRLNRERTYIADNIKMTRSAYGLDRFDQREFPAETDPAAADAANNQATLDNIRLWDVQALQATLRQVQEIRTYYDFPDIDIDRYTIDGGLRQVMLAARELSVDKLPESSRNWINDKLIYTHGYGITMNPVNGFTPEGLPTLYLANMPVQSTVPTLKVTRPEIYYGEMTSTDVFVKTRQKEFNYPEGQTNNLSTYQGTGGIALGGFLRRTLIAFDRGDLTKVPFSDDIGSESLLLMRRQVIPRVEALAPFLTFDTDPYIVVGEDGRLKWIVDAFTSSDMYPYSVHSTLGNGSVNYMRNSVKAVVDAYDGAVTFYVFDSADPIIGAWRGIFPALFRDSAEMPPWLKAHVRYPEPLLSLQAQVYGLYHMTDPEVFYNREDLWTVATQTGTAQSGEQAAQPMQPNFVVMKLPGETGQEFVEILPFTPANRNNMIGWIAARSDGEHYGKAVAYYFPKTRLVNGPQQIEARIDQNAQLSGQLTLWNQQGSHVQRGSLLVIPCGEALLYAEPIYLQAVRSPMPELRIVVLALQDKLAYGPNFETALGALFGSGSSSLTAAEGTTAAPAAEQTVGQAAAAAAPAGADVKALAGEASRDFADNQKLTSEGKLAEAGQKLDDLKRVLDQLSTRK